MISNGICLSLSAFGLVWYSLVASLLLQMALFRSFCGWAAFHDIQAPHLYLLSCQWPFRLFPRLGWASLVAQLIKSLPAMRENRVRSLHWEDSLEKAMAIHFSILAWRIPWMEEPGRLHPMRSQGVRHDWATNIHSLNPFTPAATGHHSLPPATHHDTDILHVRDL